MIKLIASDLDGTALLNGRLSIKNAEAIEKCKERGVEFAVATGRGLASIPQAIWDLEGVTYAITSNGACIINARNGEILRKYMVSEEDTLKLIEIAQSFDTGLEIFINSEAYVDQKYYDDPVKYGMPEHLRDYVHNSRRPVPDIYEYINDHLGEVESFAFVVRREIHEIVNEAAKKACPDALVIHSDLQWVEVINKECGKGNGVEHLAQYLGFDLTEVAAFGDADNDIDMLERAGLPVTMGNGSTACKAAAKKETLDVTEDGLAYGIQKILEGEWA